MFGRATIRLGIGPHSSLSLNITCHSLWPHHCGCCGTLNMSGKGWSRWVTFWATVCKMVRPMLSVRCLTCLSVCPLLSVCDVGVLWPNGGWIKMKPGMEVGLDPGHIVLDEDPALPLQKRAQPPNFRPMSVVAKLPEWSRCHLRWR